MIAAITAITARMPFVTYGSTHCQLPYPYIGSGSSDSEGKTKCDTPYCQNETEHLKNRNAM